MTRYYPGQRPLPNKKRQTNELPRWLWGVGAFLLGYLFSDWYDIASFKQFIVTQLTASDHKLAQSSGHARRQVPVVSKPKLEFYTLLTKEVGSQPVISYQPKIPPTPQPTETRPAAEIMREHYAVQLAAFAKQSDAEQMKAVLALKGFTVNVVAVEQNRVTWYRVILGPFASKNEAQAAQQAIAKREKINGMIRKASV